MINLILNGFDSEMEKIALSLPELTKRHKAGLGLLAGGSAIVAGRRYRDKRRRTSTKPMRKYANKITSGFGFIGRTANKFKMKHKWAQPPNKKMLNVTTPANWV